MVDVPAPARRPIRFGSFELDPQSGELRKAGLVVGLQDQSLKVLTELLAQPGALVTRDRLRQRLWPDGTFVDFDHGLNAVINRLRETLGDSAESPRFIQTVPRRGYRFIAPVDGVVAGGGAAAAEAPPAVSRAHPAERVKAPWARIGTVIIAIAALILVLVAIVLIRRAPPTNVPSARLLPLTRLAGKEGGPAFAADGEQVAFVWSGERHDNTDIYVTLVGSTSVRRVTTDAAEDFAPSWSPDGRRIAFLRKSGYSARIHVTSALGGPDSKLSDFPVGVVDATGVAGAQITWSLDGRHIVAGRDPRVSEGGVAGLYLIPVDGGEPRAITRPAHPTFDLAPAFSADGRRLAYLECGSIGVFLPSLLPNGCGIRMTDVDGAGIPLTAPRVLTTMQPVEPAGLAWSRDGGSLIFAMGTTAPVRLWRLWIDPHRAAERIEIAGEAVEYPATAATRDRLAFSQFAWNSRLFRFNAGLPADEVAPSSSFETDPAFSPDGRHLAFASGRSGHVQIWVAAADGSNARQLTHNTQQWPGSPSWSPNGRLIAFDSGGVGTQVRIWIVEAEGGTPRQITNGAGHQSVPRWSHDGRWIYFANDDGTSRDIWRTPVAGGAPQQVTRTGSGFLSYEFDNGTGLLYQQVHGDTALWLLPLNGSDGPRRLVDCVRASAFAPAGRTVTYVACDSSSRPPLRALDSHSGTDRLLGRLENSPPGAMHVNLAVAPDGETILFRTSIGRSGDVMIIENFR